MKPLKILVVHHTAEDEIEQRSSVNKDHEARGYPESLYGSFIAYHFMVGKDGTVVQNRALDERTYQTRNSEVNSSAVAIVVNGNFEDENLDGKQLAAVRSLIERLDAIYSFEEIIPHSDASPTACPGRSVKLALQDLWRRPKSAWDVWRITRYYHPERDQPYYFQGSYEEDMKMNCSGDCMVPADGIRYTEADAWKVAACPPEIKFGTLFEIEGLGIVTCRDHGGAIKEKRLDVWAGIGNQALFDMKRKPGYYLRVRQL